MVKPASSAAALMIDKSDSTDAGLFVIGDVVGRTRRQFEKKGGGARWNITLLVQTPEGRLAAERWCDSPAPTDIPLVGAHVRLKVNLVHFRSARGDGVRITWGPDHSGESF